MHPMFQDRQEAGQRLGRRLAALKPDHPIVLALPRGGVPVAAAIADALDAPLDLLLVRKLGTPGYPELALGAVSDGAHPRTVVNWSIVRQIGISEPQIAEMASTEIAEIERRRKLWLDDRAAPDLAGRVVIVVDDGVATGASTHVALQAVRAAGASHIVLAAPVGPAAIMSQFENECDDIVFLSTPEDFYNDFHQLDDGEVRDLLAQHRHRLDPNAEKTEQAGSAQSREHFMAKAKKPNPLITASRVEGTSVLNDSGERIGTIKDLSIDKQSGKVVYALLSFGGFLGVGERYHPLPWDILKYDFVKDGYVVSLTKAELEKAPSYSTDQLAAFGGSDLAYREQLHRFYTPYGAMPYW
jgi:putative phosphoribosyl transferase